jgi:hypothetical protein
MPAQREAFIWVAATSDPHVMEEGFSALFRVTHADRGCIEHVAGTKLADSHVIAMVDLDGDSRLDVIAHALDQDGGMFTVLGSGEDGPSYSGPVPCMDH